METGRLRLENEGRDGLVTHGRNVRAASCAGTHHNGNLGNALARHARLVIEGAPKVIAVGKDLRLQWQESATRVNQVDAGQAILLRNLLSAQMLLDRHRVVGATFDGRVVCDNHTFLALDQADPRYNTG